MNDNIDIFIPIYKSFLDQTLHHHQTNHYDENGLPKNHPFFSSLTEEQQKMYMEW